MEGVKVLNLIIGLKKKFCKHDFVIIGKNICKFQMLTDDRTMSWEVIMKCKKCGLETKQICQM